MTVKRNKNLKKLLAATLAAITVLTLPIGAFADTQDIIDTSKRASLTVYKYDEVAARAAGVDLAGFTANGERDAAAEAALAKYAIKNVGFTYLKVGNINTESKAGKVQLKYDIPAKLETILGLSNADHRYTSDEINKAAFTALADNTATKNKLEEYIKTNSGNKMAMTDATGMTKVSNLELGLYLVVETSVPEYVNSTVNPFFVSLPMTDATGDYWIYDVYAYPKNQSDLPTIDKLVSEDGNFADIATASQGDTLQYRIVSKLPTITSKATYLDEYTFIDMLAKCISYGTDVKIQFYNNESDAKNATGTPIATWEKGSDNFAVEYDSAANSMTVTMTDKGLTVINPAMSQKYMVVSYSALVKSDSSVVLGDNGNINDVSLTYSRTTDDENTIEDEARVYSYGIDLAKKFSDNAGDATKVQFVLKNVTNGYFVTATGADGVYYLTDGTKAAKESDATVFSPAADGKLVINGLEADKYLLTEIKTDKGYVLLKEGIDIEFNQTVDNITPSAAAMTGHENPNADVIIVNMDRANASVDGENAAMSADNASLNARVDVQVTNNQGFTLPYTGGAGMTLIPMLGMLLVFAAVKKFRKEEDEIETC